MASRRVLVSATTADALANEEIREIVEPSSVSLWASAVTVTDTIGLQLGRTIIMEAGTANVSAAALGQISTNEDQLVFGTLVGPGTLRLPIVVTTSLIFLLVVEPLV